MKYHLRRKKLVLLPLIFIIMVLSYYLFVIPRDKLQSLQTHYLNINKSGDIAIVKDKPSDWYEPTTNFQSNSTIVKTIILSEDWAFYQHGGVDLHQLYHSIKDALMGESLRGASTITQQVVKNIFFNSKRSFIRKFHELFYSLYLESVTSKTKILTHYLNLVELGPSVYGINRASFYYFNKAPNELDAREASFIAMLLPSPINYGESFRQKRLTDFAKSSLDRLLDKLVLAKVLSLDEKMYYLNQTFSWEQEAGWDSVDEDQDQVNHFDDEYVDEQASE